jgi:hypothetical protein
MSTQISGTSPKLWEQIYKKYHYTCVYCGFDGRPFDSWVQLSIDHVLPKNSGGTDKPENLVPACRSCNSITSRMKFNNNLSIKEIIQMKRERVLERRKIFYNNWIETVAPQYLNRPLLNA